jgi:hypothetical protein
MLLRYAVILVSNICVTIVVVRMQQQLVLVDADSQVGAVTCCVTAGCKTVGCRTCLFCCGCAGRAHAMWLVGYCRQLWMQTARFRVLTDVLACVIIPVEAA